MKYFFSDRVQSLKGSAIREIFKFAADPSVISLAGGNPAPELFPSKELSDIAQELLSEKPVLSLQYGVTEGYGKLREQIRQRLVCKENINTNENDVLIVSGGQQGIDLLSKVLLNEGDTVLVEEPSFIGALNSFRSYRANLVGIPMEQDGINLEQLESALKTHPNTKLLYTIPTFQNPSGITMSLEKRRALYQIACRYNIIILEDNPYGELSFDGTRHQTIKSLDTDGRVVYCGSFSKILSPGIRVGYVCADPKLLAKMTVVKQTSDVHTPMLTQLLVSEYLKRYDIDQAIVKMRDLYGKKCKIMLATMDEYLPKEVTHTVPTGGLFVWASLPLEYDALEISKVCATKKVVYVPGSTFMVDMDQPCSSFRLNYSCTADDKIVEGIKTLGKVFAGFLQIKN